eukprot:7287533-Prymnesium_polylepis.1
MAARCAGRPPLAFGVARRSPPRGACSRPRASGGGPAVACARWRRSVDSAPCGARASLHPVGSMPRLP